MAWADLLIALKSHFERTLAQTTVEVGQFAKVPEGRTITLTRGEQNISGLRQGRLSFELFIECWERDDDPFKAWQKLEALERAVLDQLFVFSARHNTKKSHVKLNLANGLIQQDGGAFLPSVGSYIRLEVIRTQRYNRDDQC